MTSSAITARRAYTEPAAVLELLKPITWFPQMWAYACGVVSSGAPILPKAGVAITGILLAGPLACAMSQAINDWRDRFFDAINRTGRSRPGAFPALGASTSRPAPSWRRRKSW